eukprot:TRINITY_DN10149_c0_g1_i1.p1 TRINITY_DN10149_c0_g1~~TRINITY_DN10149_c0_g1_i1.p1  ORF type:complete len:112 (-),score=12.57 TRINITY_DN10149_c0_g1_i1:128-463(-)
MATPIALIVAGLGAAGTFALARRGAVIASKYPLKSFIPKWSLPMTQKFPGGFSSTMTPQEAAHILGVKPNTPKDQIKLAHKKIITLNHPDAGGSTYLASKINEAKDCLLKK